MCIPEREYLSKNRRKSYKYSRSGIFQVFCGMLRRCGHQPGDAAAGVCRPTDRGAWREAERVTALMPSSRTVARCASTFAVSYGGQDGAASDEPSRQAVPPRLCRYISIAIGSTDTPMMPIATSEKLSLTTGTLPKT